MDTCESAESGVRDLHSGMTTPGRLDAGPVFFCNQSYLAVIAQFARSRTPEARAMRSPIRGTDRTPFLLRPFDV